MKTLISSVCLLVLTTTLPVRAGDYQIKNKSHFSFSDSAHNPFWPIGWSKPVRGPQVADSTLPAVTIKSTDFAVSSISLMQGAHCAVINGRVYGEGERVPVLINNQKALVQIVSIQDGLVVVSHGGQAISVPLKRKEDQALNRVVPIETADAFQR